MYWIVSAVLLLPCWKHDTNMETRAFYWYNKYPVPNTMLQNVGERKLNKQQKPTITRIGASSLCNKFIWRIKSFRKLIIQSDLLVTQIVAQTRAKVPIVNFKILNKQYIILVQISIYCYEYWGVEALRRVAPFKFLKIFAVKVSLANIEKSALLLVCAAALCPTADCYLTNDCVIDGLGHRYDSILFYSQANWHSISILRGIVKHGRGRQYCFAAFPLFRQRLSVNRCSLAPISQHDIWYFHAWMLFSAYEHMHYNYIKCRALM